jgi:hypothetical protein
VVAPSPAPTLGIGAPVFKAATYSFFVGSASAGTYANMLLVDPNGMASTQHLDYGNTVQPAVEGVVDFQVAVGNDANTNGAIDEGAPATDEWIGNASGETIPGAASGTLPTTVRQVRLSLLFQTLNGYAGAPPVITAFEDRPSNTYPTMTTGGTSPRYRSARIVVSPRAWNLTE